MPFEKHCKVIYSVTLIRNHQVSYLYSFPNRTYESSFADQTSTVVFTPNRTFTLESFRTQFNPRDIHLPYRDVIVHYLNKVQETNEFLEEPIVVSSAIDVIRIKQQFFGSIEVEKFKKR